MFNRVEYKERAKVVLKQNYWICFLATLVCTFIINIGVNSSSGGGNNGIVFSFGIMRYPIINFSFADFGLTEIITMLLIILPMIILAVIFSIVYTILVKNMFEVGQCKFYLEARDGNYDFTNIIYAYQSGNAKNLIKTMFLRSLFVALWTILLFIPGIIKSYSYYFVPYILAENPDMNSMDALHLSEDLTSGIKMELFILDISFFLWSLLNLVTFGLFRYVLNPYIEATKAEAYAHFAKNDNSYDYMEF